MFTPAVSAPRSATTIREKPSTFPVKWNELDLRAGKLPTTIINSIVTNQYLKGSQLSCVTGTEAGQWKNRKIFIEKVAADIIAQCPKDEPLVFISLGADRLLTEYILGKTLIENGFGQISFLLVDPAYIFSEREELKVRRQVLKDFREKIESVYLRTYQEHFAKERIHYLPRSQNIAKHFPSSANVVVIESLPPYAEIMKDIQKYHMEEKEPKDLLAGSRITPPSHANAVAFIPASYVRQLKQVGVTLRDSLPLAIFESVQSYFYMDWGCKIQPDGTYRLSFSGEKHYLEGMGISKNDKIQLESGEIIQAGQWVPILRTALEKKLSEQIERIKEGNLQKRLSPENLTMLLEKVKEVATLYMAGIGCFFLADYMLDREEAMEFIASHAGHHYRKAFSLLADANTGYKISVNEIS
ncbi:hypothetical protein [Parachlamydia sp. AcF125]|uniref:hypothetical protein n=1 Tax=Parachlamydia sp. AcF125 TaxID=2795736 RepID=UPI001BC99826|nr:hypothetical protein [Parachlamydia sp. AcF125]MBS4168322.1 hypothetical protein [Parachlamydia sp. AcF125]